ncbi:MAG: GxxExxY protein [Candidatus Scalindua sp.]
MDDRLIYKEEAYRIIGLCMEVHGILGKGHSEVVYKDALEHEFSINQIPFSRERSYKIKYKDIILPRGYNADFVVVGWIKRSESTLRIWLILVKRA